MRLSPNFTLEELCVSNTAARMGREIEPDAEITTNLISLCRNVLQPTRELLDTPVIINSGYRPEWLNRRIGGSKTSQHMAGSTKPDRPEEAAVDFRLGTRSKLSLYDAAQMIVESDIPVDQIILEFNSWIHISWSEEPRYEVLTAYSERAEGVSRTRYVQGLIKGS
jgi:zinc D-Ala-D-Ala carboxypeptidase